jgi:hypothetical protein
MATLADLWRRVICSKITTESPIYRCLGSKIECVKLYRTRLKIISFISREKKLSIWLFWKSRLTNLDLQFLTCNSWLASHKMCHSKAQKDLCATGSHKMCHSTAQKYFYTYVPQDGTKCATARHKMCHSTAQNVPQHGTKCATARDQKTFKLMCHNSAQKDF